MRDIPPPADGRPARCAVQVDLDSFRVLLRYRGYDGGDSAERFYDLVIPRLLALFGGRDIAATLFVVGADIEGPAGRWLSVIESAGHEVASHSHTHPFGITRMSDFDQETELARAEEGIAARTGRRPVGFRSPGYDVDGRLISRLERRGYLYDSSVFPSVAQLGIRLYQALVRRRRSARHGRMGGAMVIASPLLPYLPARDRVWRRGDSRIVEIPVGTIPFLRLPFHATTALAWGRPYVELALRAMGTRDLAFVMHGADVLDRAELDPRLYAQPGLGQPLARKLAILSHVFDRLGARCTFVTSGDHARRYLDSL